MIKAALKIKGGVLPFDVKIGYYIDGAIDLIIDYMAKLIRYDEIQAIEYVIWFDTEEEKKFINDVLKNYKGFKEIKIQEAKFIVELDKDVATQPSRFLHYFIIVNSLVKGTHYKINDNFKEKKDFNNWKLLIDEKEINNGI